MRNDTDVSEVATMVNKRCLRRVYLLRIRLLLISCLIFGGCNDGQRKSVDAVGNMPSSFFGPVELAATFEAEDVKVVVDGDEENLVSLTGYEADEEKSEFEGTLPLAEGEHTLQLFFYQDSSACPEEMQRLRVAVSEPKDVTISTSNEPIVFPEPDTSKDDTDNDGIPNWDEIINGTNPCTRPENVAFTISKDDEQELPRSLDVTWDAVENANAYKIYLHDQSGLPPDQHGECDENVSDLPTCFEVTSASRRLNELDPLRTYYVKVTAVWEEEGLPSVEVSGQSKDAFENVIASLRPEENAEDVDVNPTVSATFQIPMNSETVTNDTFLLRDLGTNTGDGTATLERCDGSGTEVAGQVSYDTGAQTAAIALNSVDRLALTKTYCVIVRSGIKAEAGHSFVSDYSWQFKIRDGEWGSGKQVKEDEIPQRVPQQAAGVKVAVDGDGNVFSVWRQDDGVGEFDIWAGRYSLATETWKNFKRLARQIGGANDPAIAADANGNAIAVWRQISGSIGHIRASRYDVAKEVWDDSVAIGPEDGDATNPTIALDGEGNAVAVWRQNSGSGWNIWAARYLTQAGGWAAEPAKPVSSAGSAAGPTLGINKQGNAFAVWSQNDDGIVNVFGSRCEVNGVCWSNPDNLESEDTAAVDPDVAVDDNGNAVAVWAQRRTSDTVQTIMANRYVDGVWVPENAREIRRNDDEEFAFKPSVAVDGAGNAIVVWYQKSAAGSRIWASRYDAERMEWEAAVELDNGAGNAADPAPAVAFEDAGNAIAVWQQAEVTETEPTVKTRHNIWVNRRVAGNVWNSAEEIETDDNDTSNPALAVHAASGVVTVLWLQSNTGTIWYNRFE